MKLSDNPSLESFLADEPTATIAVPIDEQGTLHAAALRYWYSSKPLRFYFVTGKDTEKCKLLKQKKAVTAACVVGTVRDVAFTLQMRGELTIINPADYREIVERYYEKRGNHHDDVENVKNVLLEFTPNWARVTDYANGYKHHFLELA